MDTFVLAVTQVIDTSNYVATPSAFIAAPTIGFVFKFVFVVKIRHLLGSLANWSRCIVAARIAEILISFTRSQVPRLGILIITRAFIITKRVCHLQWCRSAARFLSKMARGAFHADSNFCC